MSEEGAPSPESTTVCPQCGVPVDAPAGFCSACGAEVAATATAVAGSRRRGRGAATGDAAERSLVRREFGRIKGIVLVVRAVFVASAVLCAVLLAALLASPGPGAAGAAVRTTIQIVLCVELAVALAGAFLVLRAPLLWTTVAACMWTLDTALLLWLGDGALPPDMLLRLFLTLSFWFAVAQAARVQRLMAADPSLQIVRARIDPSRRVVGGVADTARERGRRERATGRARRWRLLGGIAAGVLLVGLVLWQALRPPAVETAIATFAASWARGDAAAIADALPPARARVWRDDFERRGFALARPALGEPAVQARGGVVLATFATDAGPVETTWELADRTWLLLRVDVPPLVAPEPAPALAAFRTAWAAAGTDALVALVRPASRERLGRDLARILERRGWGAARPPLGELAPDAPREGRVRASFALGDDEVRVTFEFWHPQWWLTATTLPRE